MTTSVYVKSNLQSLFEVTQTGDKPIVIFCLMVAGEEVPRRLQSDQRVHGPGAGGSGETKFPGFQDRPERGQCGGGDGGQKDLQGKCPFKC